MGVLLSGHLGGAGRLCTEEPADSELYARSACLMDADSGRVLYERREEKRPNASTTKIVTCILALENGNPDDTVTSDKTRGRSAQGTSRGT